MNEFMKAALDEAYKGIRADDGGPFGCVIVKDGKIVGRGHNCVLKEKGPTLHGEMVAIKDACKNLGTYDLTGCELYTTAQPCPMCLGAILWAKIEKVYYGCNINDTDKIGFRDEVFYKMLGGEEPVQTECIERDACLELFTEYGEKEREIY